MNRTKLISIFIVILFCSNPFLITCVGFQNLNLTSDNEKNVNLNLSNSILNEEITLIVGSNEDNVEMGVLTFVNNLHKDIEINKQENILSSETNDIIIIFSHGSEKGINMNGELISWSDLSELISQTKADLIVLAACYGANIYDFIETDDKQVIGFDGIIDALIIGYFCALEVNTYFNHNDEADSNFKSCISRLILILNQPEQIRALVWTRCWKLDKFFLWIPIQLKCQLDIKLNSAEVAFGGGVVNIVRSTLLMEISIAGAILIILLTVVEFCVNASKISHSHAGVSGAWVSLVTQLIPIPGIFWQAHDPDGNVIAIVPVNPGDPTITATLGSLLRANLHDWRYLHII